LALALINQNVSSILLREFNGTGLGMYFIGYFCTYCRTRRI
jgi:hypothetical protein